MRTTGLCRFLVPLLVVAFQSQNSIALLHEEDLVTYVPSRSEIHHHQDDDDVLKYMDGVWSVTTHNGESNRSSTTKSFGHSNIPYNETMPSDAHFPIGSNSKLYTSVAIYQLHEQGKLDVDADIATMLEPQDYENFGVDARKYCPRVGTSVFSWKCEKITLRNLMMMASGIYPSLNCNADPNAPNQCNPDPFFLSRGSIGLTVGTFLFEPLMFKPGSAFHYSNPNFVLAAYFVEKYSGMSFRDYLHNNIFSRIGLEDTYFDFYNGALGLDTKRPAQYIKYYDSQNGELISVGADIVQLDLGVASGTGGILSTVQDHVTFWYALFNKATKGAPLLSPSSQKAILTPWSLAAKQDGFQYPNGTTSSIWVYYTQGTVILCDGEGCPNGPCYIQYMGGTITVHTANLLDYHTFKMVQVWTSTIVAMTDSESFKAAFERQTGSLAEVIEPWVRPDVNYPMAIAWQKMYQQEGTAETYGSTLEK